MTKLSFIIIIWRSPIYLHKAINQKSSYHLYIIRTILDTELEKKKEIFKKLHIKKIFVGLHYIPIYRHPFYKNFAYDFNDYPNSELFYRTAISLPIYPSLTKNDQEYVINNLGDILSDIEHS